MKYVIHDTQQTGSVKDLRIGFYGAGRVGCTLGRYFREHGLKVTGYYNRTPDKAKEAAEWTGTLAYDSPMRLIMENDVLFLTVSDGAISSVLQDLCQNKSTAGLLEKNLLSGKFLIHTSGALSSEVFSGTGAYGYSIHPLYAISDRKTSYETLNRAFFTVEGDAEFLDQWVQLLTGIGLFAKPISAAEKVRYHASAVMASNLVCGLYHAASEELVACGFSKEEAETALSGLFLDNARGIAERGVTRQLTGPVERGDAETVKKHLAKLEGEHRKMYILLSEQALEVAKEKNPERDYTELEDILSLT